MKLDAILWSTLLIISKTSLEIAGPILALVPTVIFNDKFVIYNYT